MRDLYMKYFFAKKFCEVKNFVFLHAEKRCCGFSSAGRAEASQASGRGFEPRNPLRRQEA